MRKTIFLVAYVFLLSSIVRAEEDNGEEGPVNSAGQGPNGNEPLSGLGKPAGPFGFLSSLGNLFSGKGKQNENGQRLGAEQPGAGLSTGFMGGSSGLSSNGQTGFGNTPSFGRPPAWGSSSGLGSQGSNPFSWMGGGSNSGMGMGMMGPPPMGPPGQGSSFQFGNQQSGLGSGFPPPPPNQASGFMFGGSSNQGSGFMFGNRPQGFMFGAPPQMAGNSGQDQSTGGGLFGRPTMFPNQGAVGGGLFGKPTFGSGMGGGIQPQGTGVSGIGGQTFPNPTGVPMGASAGQTPQISASVRQ